MKRDAKGDFTSAQGRGRDNKRKANDESTAEGVRGKGYGANEKAKERGRRCSGGTAGEPCSRHPTYGFPSADAAAAAGENFVQNPKASTRVRCGKHKLAGMVDLKSRRCEAQGCYRQPLYSSDGKVPARFCSAHKSADMVNVRSGAKKAKR